MCEDHYLPTQFNYIEYEAASGGLSCPEAATRSNYYGVGGIPHINFDGNWDTQVGSGSGDVTGVSFINKIDTHLAVEAPMSVSITDFSYEAGSAFAEVTIEMFADIGSPAGHVVRVAIVEDYLVYSGSTYHNTCRTMPTGAAGVPLTVSAVGETQVLNLPFTPSGWNTDNLQIIAWVQRESDKYVIQSGNSWVVDYGAALAATGSQQVVADGSEVLFDPTTISNVGLLSETFDISIDTSDLPDGWDAHLVYDGGDYQSFSVTLDPYNQASFNVAMSTGLVGSGHVVVNVASQTTGDLLDSMDFVALAGGTDLLIVSDDNGAGNAYDVYGPAIGATGKTYAIWDNALAQVTDLDLAPYEAVIWQSGDNNSTLDGDDRDAVNAYLGDGGALILAGNDILESLYAQGGSARLWYQLKLRINYSAATNGDPNVNGVMDDPIGDGINFTLTGGDADVMTLFSGQPVWATFEFGDGAVAGSRTEYGGYKVVTFPFGMEFVPEQEIVNTIMHNSLDWLGVLTTNAVDNTLPEAGMALAQNHPNPFNPSTKISLRIDQSGPAKLEIFNARGQLVRVLVDGAMEAGVHEVSWNGRTDSGAQAASGTYFYKLNANGEQLTRKMTLVK